MQLQHTELNNRKSLKKTPCISTQRIIMTKNSQKRKSLKNYGLKNELKITIIFSFLR